MSGDLDNPTHGARLYLRRRGRRTRGQARALTELAPRFRLGDGPIDAREAFGRPAPLGVEIGFGMGHALIDWAVACPDWNLLGIEVYEPGIGSALLGIERHGLDNVRLVEGDAEQVLETRLAPESVDEIRIFFPDPWPKLRHHKRRLLQPPFAALLARRLRPGGLLWVATDWADYAEWIIRVLDGTDGLERMRARVEAEPVRDRGSEAAPTVADRARPATRFEARGRRLGHSVWDLRYRRKR